MISWRSPFDEVLASEGPPAVFTLDHKGRLGMDEARTRESWTRLETIGELIPCHCLFEDRATGWHQYVLVTAEALCSNHPRARVHRYPSAEAALAALEAMGGVTIRRAGSEGGDR